MSSFLKRLASTVLLAAGFAALAGSAPAAQLAAGEKPNILWILGDDLGPDLACYGAPAVRTPNLDRLASEGVRYTHAFTTAPVCSPSRSALMTAMYQTSIGAHHHRSHRMDGYRLPEGVRTITDRLRERGYFTANITKIAPGLRASGKTDFNFTVEKPFDGDDWAQLKPRQPFFAEINFTEPHRGPAWPQARKEPNLVNPAEVFVPPYYPEHRVVRDDYANYYDATQLLDRKVGQVLKLLEEQGLAQNTIVFFFGDNGRCHVRDKQWLYDGGTHIPLIVRWPGKLKPGTVDDRLVSNIDIAATTLRLAGVELPKTMQGQPFLGPDAKERPQVFAARDRCDETVDRIRSVRTKRYLYIRNFRPELRYTQPNAYKERQYPALQVMKELHAEGKLTPEQALFMANSKPVEELFDMQEDPHQLRNLAASEKHLSVLREMRGALERWIKETGDLGAQPEQPGAQ
jgi:N-sulfoglucosamine sulfohydrolase